MVVQVLVFPFTSVTVNVTVLGPTSAQVKLLGSMESDAIPQLSVEPLSMSVTEMVALPEASNCTVKGAAQFATGVQYHSPLH